MINNPFMVGDRVQAKNKRGPILPGDTGTVCAEELDTGRFVRVCWDKNVGGHSCGGRCKRGFGFNLEPEALELVCDIEYVPYTQDEILTLLGGVK